MLVCFFCFVVCVIICLAGCLVGWLFVCLFVHHMSRERTVFALNKRFRDQNISEPFVQNRIYLTQHYTLNFNSWPAMEG